MLTNYLLNHVQGMCVSKQNVISTSTTQYVEIFCNKFWQFLLWDLRNVFWNLRNTNYIHIFLTFGEITSNWSIFNIIPGVILPSVIFPAMSSLWQATWSARIINLGKTAKVVQKEYETYVTEVWQLTSPLLKMASKWFVSNVVITLFIP